MIKYEIYPIPQEIEYFEGQLSLNVEFNLILNEKVDEVNKNKIEKLLSSKKINLSDNANKLIILEFSDNLINHDEYQLEISTNEIKIIAKDNDALFYGIQTLEAIFEQSKNDINKLKISDYASIKYRGIIEGFYGIPWSWKNKKELLRFGSKFKNNLFIFAPKDDPYHREKWYELYPEKELNLLGEMAKLGNEYKNRFVYTISPFKKESNPISKENFEESVSILIEKFEQLYSVGVKQFGVLGDDVGKLPNSVVVDVMNRLSAWSKEKGDVKDFLYCPASYVLTWAWDAQELNAYTEGFPEDVHIFFTGKETCSPVNKADVDKLKTKEIDEAHGGTGKERRDPFFWLNWPVNDIDINYRKLYMGKGELLYKDVDNIVGLVTNPMQEANASKVAIFAVSDYSWNIKSFDCEKSWNDSFKYIDKFAFEELKTIAAHMANQNEKGIQELEESEDFKELQFEFNKAMDNALVSEVKDVLGKIKPKFEFLVKTVDRYFAKSKEVKLIKEVKPYFDAFRELLLSGVYYIDSFGALEEGQKEIGLKLYDKARYYNEKYAYHSIDADPKSNRFMKKSETSTLRINPIITRLKEYLDKIFAKRSNLSHAEKIFYRGLDNSKSYRIPALLETKEGTLLAFADKRNEHQYDWGNIDLVVRRKEKGQKVFSKNLVIIDPVDQDGGEMPPYVTWPVDLDIGDKSAFTIDPVVLQSNSGKIFAFVTAFPQSKGFFSIRESGNGYVEVEGNKYLELFDKEENRYYVKDSKVYTLKGELTEFTVKKDEIQPFHENGDLYKGSVKVGNIFLMNSELFIQQTSHILMTCSEDDGKTWSYPIDLNPQVKESWMKFMGVAPGRGITLKSGRIIFPAYFTNEYTRQNTCLVYSDDDGKTWHRSQSVNENRKIEDEILNDKEEYNYFYQTSESQLVQLDNGDIKVFVRNQFHGKPVHIQIATSKDNGETFESELVDVNFESQSNCQLSVVHTHYQDKEYVLVSSPSSAHSNERFNGRIYIGEVSDTGEINFVNSKYISFGMFWYSSMEKFGNKFAIMYEGGDSLMHNDMDIMYREFNWEYLLENEETLRYEIYPAPKHLEYRYRSTYLNKTFELNFGEGISDYNKLKLNEIIDELNFDVTEDSSIKVNLKLDESLEKFDQYTIEIEENIINISAQSNDALYYSYMTLLQIFEQNSKFVRNLYINDYATQKIRGTIEGYYGIPYSTELRKDVIEFSSKIKANVFIYAPKDDPYHREKWFEPYPAKELEDFKMLGELGNKIKTRFVWTISPFKKECNPINEESFEENIKLLLAKLDQVYEIGLRQFGVLGDDVGALPKEVVVKVMNRVNEWAKSKKDKIYDFVFVPEGYVLADWGFRPDELDLYSSEFPDNVQIMFTGDNTCAPITQKSVIDFKNREIKRGERRDPLFWLNWPVNDIDRTSYRRLFMGKGEMLEPGTKGLVGSLTNPLEEGYASLVALFAIADYSWNTEDFYAQKSWEASFKYIDENVSDELYEICKHMSNTDASGTNSDNGGISNLEESEELKTFIENFEETFESDNIFEYRYNLYKLKREYFNIYESIEKYYKNFSNSKLAVQIKPYVLNLRDKSKAAFNFIFAIELIKKNELEKAKEKFEIGKKLLKDSKKYEVFTKTSEFPAKNLKAVSGTYRIDKNIAQIVEFLTKTLK